MQNIIITDSSCEEINDLKKGIEEETKEEWVIISEISNWGRNNIFLRIKRYVMYFLVPLKILLFRNNYKRIVGWQQFYTLVYCFYCSLLHLKKVNEVYVINFTYKEKKGAIGKAYYLFMCYILRSKYIDYLFVPSSEYQLYCSEQFNISPTKFISLPFGIPDRFSIYETKAIEGDYFLSIGRSNRDYDWLIEEWKKINQNLIIICDTYVPKEELSKNIQILSNVSGEKQFPYIMGCKALIIPIKEGKICSGDTALLSAMSFGKNAIVTQDSTLAEMYIKNGDNGFIISKENDELRQIIQKIAEKRIDCGKRARESFLNNYSRRIMGMRIGQYINDNS